MLTKQRYQGPGYLLTVRTVHGQVYPKLMQVTALGSAEEPCNKLTGGWPKKTCSGISGRAFWSSMSTSVYFVGKKTTHTQKKPNQKSTLLKNVLVVLCYIIVVFSSSRKKMKQTYILT